MPSSPALRYSPGKGQKVEVHRRGRSLEESLLVKDKEDDLELFSELQLRERESFLLQSTDDFENTFSMRLKHLSDIKLGTNPNNESSELLNVDAEKNDYDWLLTPPETPLFPSLDDETLPANVVTRGRPRSQPISTSRSSTKENNFRSRRGSPSPNRISRSPGSFTSSTSRGRPSSSPTSSHRSITPSLRSSPPPNKGLISAPRSSSSNPRRMSTGSSNHATSPLRTNRGNSPSQKIRAWQSNIPGFSSDAPPNLRTSFADRPASYVRGSSPACRNNRRKSTSPTSFRRMQDIDHSSSSRKALLNLGGHVDIESLQSGNTDQISSKKAGAVQSNRSPGISKKPSRAFSPSYTPKRTSESLLENRKSPPNMFRPLLSSAPTSTFLSGKVTSAHQSLISQHSSAPTSSNTSLDHGHTFSLGIVQDLNSDLPEDHVYHSVDALNEDKLPCEQLHVHDIDKDEDTVSAIPLHHSADIKLISTSGDLGVGIDALESCSMLEMNVCDRCGCKYPVTSSKEPENNLCIDCRQELSMVASVPQVGDHTDSGVSTMQLTRVSCPSELCKQHVTPCDETEICSLLDEQGNFQSLEKACAGSLAGDCEAELPFSVSDNSLDCQIEFQKNFCVKESWHPVADLSEVTGLKKSSSCTSFVFQEKSSSASTTTTYDDLLYARDQMRGSVGYPSSSASSSVDFSSTRMGELRRKLSLKKTNTESKRIESHARSQSCSSVPNPALHMGEKHAGMNMFPLVDMKLTKQVESITGNKVKLRGSQDYKMGTSESWIADESNLDHVLDENYGGTVFSSYQLGELSLEDKSMNSFLHHERISSFGKENMVFCLNDDQPSIGGDMPIALNNCNDGATKRFSVSEIGLNSRCHDPVSDMENSERSKSVTGSYRDTKPPNHDKNEFSTIEVESSYDSHILPEECVVVLSERGENQRTSLTLDEATDRILFCSSLVNDMVHHAATIAVDKESSIQYEGFKPTVTVLGSSNSSKQDPLGDMKSSSKFHKVKQHKQTSSYAKAPCTEAEKKENKKEGMVRNFDAQNKVEVAKPGKHESKCNCRIM